jgi:hypothetical protein
LHAIAAGAGVTYEQLTGDHSQVTYLSGRVAQMELRELIQFFQWVYFIPMGMQGHVMNWFLDAAFVAGRIKSTEQPVRVDPAALALDRSREGHHRGQVRDPGRPIATVSAKLREMGKDPDDCVRRSGPTRLEETERSRHHDRHRSEPADCDENHPRERGHHTRAGRGRIVDREIHSEDTAMKAAYIINARDKAAHVERCVRSAFAQTGCELEIILSDQGSTDGTREILGALAAEYVGPAHRARARLPAHRRQARHGGRMNAHLAWVMSADRCRHLHSVGRRRLRAARRAARARSRRSSDRRRHGVHRAAL